jgi:hypothetical protein
MYSFNRQFYKPILTNEFITTEYQNLLGIAKKMSPDKCVQIAAELFYAPGRSSIGVNHLPEGFFGVDSLWDKSDIDLGEGILLNKRDIVIHAEIDALRQVKDRVCKGYGMALVTSLPCQRCVVELLDAGFKTIIYGSTVLNNFEMKIKKSRFMIEHYKSDDPVVVLHVSELGQGS